MGIYLSSMLCSSTHNRTPSTMAVVSSTHIPGSYDVVRVVAQVVYFDSIEGRDDFLKRFENHEVVTALHDPN